MLKKLIRRLINSCLVSTPSPLPQRERGEKGGSPRNFPLSLWESPPECAAGPPGGMAEAGVRGRAARNFSNGVLMLASLMMIFSAVPVTLAESAGAVSGTEVVDAGNKICPVSGDEVNPEVSYVHEGRRYHFCCAGCIKKFKKKPAQYIAQLEVDK